MASRPPPPPKWSSPISETALLAVRAGALVEGAAFARRLPAPVLPMRAVNKGAPWHRGPLTLGRRGVSREAVGVVVDGRVFKGTAAILGVGRGAGAAEGGGGGLLGGPWGARRRSGRPRDAWAARRAAGAAHAHALFEVRRKARRRKDLFADRAIDQLPVRVVVVDPLPIHVVGRAAPAYTRAPR